MDGEVERIGFDLGRGLRSLWSQVQLSLTPKLRYALLPCYIEANGKQHIHRRVNQADVTGWTILGLAVSHMHGT